MRILFLIFGITAFIAGVIGIFLPILPTVPFMLLAAYCFARSSDRLHDWLMSHPKFGPPIHDWVEKRAITRRVKLFATASIFAAFFLAVWFGVKPIILGIQVGILSLVLIFIWTRTEA